MQRGYFENNLENAKICKQITIFVVDKYTTYLLVSGVGVVIHLHHNSFVEADTRTRVKESKR